MNSFENSNLLQKSILWKIQIFDKFRTEKSIYLRDKWIYGTGLTADLFLNLRPGCRVKLLQTHSIHAKESPKLWRIEVNFIESSSMWARTMQWRPGLVTVSTFQRFNVYVRSRWSDHDSDKFTNKQSEILTKILCKFSKYLRHSCCCGSFVLQMDQTTLASIGLQP